MCVCVCVCVCVYKQDLALNNLQWLICHKTHPNPTQNQSGPRCLLIILVYCFTIKLSGLFTRNNLILRMHQTADKTWVNRIEHSHIFHQFPIQTLIIFTLWKGLRIHWVDRRVFQGMTPNYIWWWGFTSHHYQYSQIISDTECLYF